MSWSFFYCGHLRFKIHNLWKIVLIVYLYVNCEESYGIVLVLHQEFGFIWVLTEASL